MSVIPWYHREGRIHPRVNKGLYWLSYQFSNDLHTTEFKDDEKESQPIEGVSIEW